MRATSDDHKSQAAWDAQAMSYGDESYWRYLDETASEHYAKGIENAYTQTLGEALAGNEGD